MGMSFKFEVLDLAGVLDHRPTRSDKISFDELNVLTGHINDCFPDLYTGNAFLDYLMAIWNILREVCKEKCALFQLVFPFFSDSTTYPNNCLKKSGNSWRSCHDCSFPAYVEKDTSWYLDHASCSRFCDLLDMLVQSRQLDEESQHMEALRVVFKSVKPGDVLKVVRDWSTFSPIYVLNILCSKNYTNHSWIKTITI